MNGPPDEALRLQWHRAFRSTFCILLASLSSASAAVGGLCHAAECPVR